MTDTPKKTLTLKRISSDNTVMAAPGSVTRGRKRIIRREDLPVATRPSRPGKPNNQGGKLTSGKKKTTRKPDPKKPVIAPSDLKARELNDRLNAFPIWRDYQPLALGVDKDVFRLVNDEHFPGASKKVVQKVLRMHTHHRRYLESIQQGGGRFHLDGKEEGGVTDQQQQLAVEMIQKTVKQ